MPNQQPAPPQFSMLRERPWSMVALICLLVAAFFLWRWQLDVAFVVATLGVLAWFLDVRRRLSGAYSLANERVEAENVGERNEEQTTDH